MARQSWKETGHFWGGPDQRGTFPDSPGLLPSLLILIDYWKDLRQQRPGPS